MGLCGHCNVLDVPPRLMSHTLWHTEALRGRPSLVARWRYDLAWRRDATVHRRHSAQGRIADVF